MEGSTLFGGFLGGKYQRADVMVEPDRLVPLEDDVPNSVETGMATPAGFETTRRGPGRQATGPETERLAMSQVVTVL